MHAAAVRLLWLLTGKMQQRIAYPVVWAVLLLMTPVMLCKPVHIPDIQSERSMSACNQYTDRWLADSHCLCHVLLHDVHTDLKAEDGLFTKMQSM